MKYLKYTWCIRTLLLISAFFLTVRAQGQLTQYAIGTPGNELATNISRITSDGSTIIAGYTYDIVSGAVTHCQCYVLKIGSSGTIAWQKTFGVAGRDNILQDMIITQDGNILIAGNIGRTSAALDSKAGLFKFNAATGALMWQTVLHANPATSAGEVFFGIAEMNDGRIVAVGTVENQPSLVDGLICVFSSTGTLQYTDRYGRSSTDVLVDVTKTAVGNSVYIGGYFVGAAYHDVHIFKYSPGAASGVVDWDKTFDFSINGNLQNNFVSRVYETGTKLMVTGGCLNNYSLTSGAGQYVLTVNAADGSSPQLRSLKNSGMFYANAPCIMPVNSDKIYNIQTPAASFYDVSTPTTGATVNAVITEVTSLTAKTANTPVRFTLPGVGENGMYDGKLDGSTLYLTGTTNNSFGFGGNDIYYVTTGLSFASTTASCDTIRTTISIRDTTITPGAFTFTHSTIGVTYITVPIADASFYIKVLCGDALLPAFCDSVSMPDSLHLCQYDTVTMPGTLSGFNPVLDYLWTPPTGLSSSTIFHPLLTATTSGWYTLRARNILPGNLVTNGTFGAGATGFTSSYTPQTPPTTSPGHYDVVTNPSVYSFASFGDHTTGTGKMLLIDASTTAGVSFWCETMTVTPGTDYVFTIWAALLYLPVPPINIKINGVSVGTFSPSSTVGTWGQYQVVWNSGAATSANICLYDLDLTSYGNDFVVDDISFQEICTAKDSIYVAVALPTTTTSTKDTTICGPATTITLTATPGATSYTWSDGVMGATHTASATGTLWVRGNTSGCTIRVDTFHVAFLPIPVVNLGNDTSFCSPDSMVLTSVQPVGYAYLWSTGSTANNIHVTATGTYWLRVSNGACRTTDTIHVTIVPSVITTVSKDTVVCGPIAAITLNATAGYGTYLWNDGSTSATRIVSASGTYWVKGTLGCSQHTDTFHVTVLVTPVVNLGNDTAFCSPDSLVLTSVQPAGYIYLWSTGSTANNIHITVTGTYWLRVSNGICSTTDTIHVDVVISDITASSKDTVVCGPVAGISLNATPGYATYLWNDGSTSATRIVSASGTYWVKGTFVCSQHIDTFHVTVVPTPVVNLGNDTSFCVGDSLVITSPQPAGSVYLWSTGSTANNIHITVSGTYWLRVTNSICTTTDTIHVLVSPHPVVNLGPDTVQCDGLPVTLQSSITYAGATYLWSNLSVAPSTLATTTNTYWLRVTVAGCAGSDTIHVAVVYDTFTLHANDTAICRGQSVSALVTGNPFISYVWTPTAGISNPFSATAIITPDTPATYIVQAFYPGCPAKRDSFHLDVQPNPLVYIGGNRSVCEFDSLHIHAYVTPGWYTHYHYSWTPAANIDSGGVSSVIFRSNALKTVIVTVTTPAGCKGIDSAQMTVYSNNFATLDTTIHLCPHDSARLMPRSTDINTTYNWHPSWYLDDAALAQPMAKPLSSQDYYAIATSQYGCLDTVRAHIVVHPGATIYLGDSVLLYPGESIQLNPQTNCTRFWWFPPAGLSDPFISNPLATPLVNTKYVVNAWTEWNCMASDSINVRISVESIVDLPNAFSPGGSNKTFKVLKRGLATLNYFRIYNRWGNLVYDSKDIDAGWDGTYKGVPQPYDVYVYQVQAVTNSGTVINKAGNVTLLR